jgi:hypothetical protein
MDTALVELVWLRALSLCEYCQMPQDYERFSHQIDHVIAKKHKGTAVSENLALACFPCNNHKGPNLAGMDIVTKKLTKLFNPRRHTWARHFRWNGPVLVGRTAVGRVTIAVLEINATDRVQLRQSLIEESVFPPLTS